MPNNNQRYVKVFVEALGLSPDLINGALIYNSVPAWDSVGHMTLMAALETEFDIMLDTEDIIAFSSYGKGMEILAKYGVEIKQEMAADAAA
jgi:acyl carrier protein